MTGDYPRDLIGYGETPPDPDWPGGARIAVQFVINYEEGGENCILHGDAASEAFLSEIFGAQPWPGQRHMNVESVYEYGSRAGFWRLHRLFTAPGIPPPASTGMGAPRRGPTGAGAPASPCKSSSITRKAARTAFSTATPRRRLSSRRSSARSPGRASAT